MQPRIPSWPRALAALPSERSRTPCNHQNSSLWQTGLTTLQPTCQSSKANAPDWNGCPTLQHHVSPSQGPTKSALLCESISAPLAHWATAHALPVSFLCGCSRASPAGHHLLLILFTQGSLSSACNLLLWLCEGPRVLLGSLRTPPSPYHAVMLICPLGAVYPACGCCVSCLLGTWICLLFPHSVLHSQLCSLSVSSLPH